MKIAVRLDDVTADMDWESFLGFKGLADRFGIRPLIGVVPDNRDGNLEWGAAREDFWEFVRGLQQEGWSVALHGYQHLYSTGKGGIFPLNCFSEFAGVSLEGQKEMLEKGVEIFKAHGIVTDIFMAPGHSYDRNTLRALKELGFSFITDGFGSRPYRFMGLTFLPIAFHGSRDIRKKYGYTTLVYHLNGTSGDQLGDYESLFKAHKQDFISFTEYCQTEAMTATVLQRFKEKCMAYFKFSMVRLRPLLKRK